MNKPIKLLFFCRSHPYWGGVERWLAYLVKALREKNFDVTLCLLEGSTFNKPDKFADSLQIDDYVPLRALSGAADIREHVIEEAIDKFGPDIVLPVLSLDALKVTCKLKDIYGYKIVYPVHEYGVGVCRDLDTFGQSIDKVVCVEELSAKFLPEYIGLEIDKFETIHACVDPVFLLSRRNKSKPDTKKLVGVCGRWIHQKGPEEAVAICEEIVQKDSSILIKWAGLDSAISEKYVRIKNMVESGNLELMGNLKHSEMRQFYAEIDCLLISSTHENGPLVAWEAMAQNVLVVTSDYLGIKAQNFLKHNYNCLRYSLGDINSAADAVIVALTNNNLFRSLTEQAKEDVLKQRSLEVVVSKWVSLLLQIRIATDIATQKPLSLKVIGVWLRLKETLRLTFGAKYLPSSAREEWTTHLLEPQGKFSHQKILEHMREFESLYFTE